MIGRAAWLAVALLAAGPAAAFDIGPILEARRLDTLQAAPGETILAAAPAVAGQAMPAVGRVGRRWGYVSWYDTPTGRGAHSGPFAFGRCEAVRASVRMAAFGEGGGAALFQHCPEGVDPLWILLPGGDVLSLDPARPTALTRWAGATPAEALLAALAAGWAASPPRDARYQPIPPAAWTLAEAPALPALAPAHAAAIRAWRRGRAPDAQRARTALRALGPLLDRTDWFAPGAPAAIANDAGFWLQQSGGCAEAADAAALLAAVLRADPGRLPAHLNRADALDTLARCGPDARAGREAREEYRFYCSATPLAAIPGGIRRRIATALEVPVLDAEACRPRLGAHRAIAAGDHAALATLLAEHPEDATEPDPRGRFPLAAAIARQDEAAARLLLDAGADADRQAPSEHAFPPLVAAAWNGDVAMVRLLIAHRARVDPFRPPAIPLHAAAAALRQHGEAVSLALLRLMLDAGAPADAADEEGRTTLMEAAGAAAPPAVVDLLVARGARVNRVTRNGQNAAFAVAPFSPAAAATLDALVAAGINLGQQDRDGMTALNHLFAWTGRRPEVVRLVAARMVAAGADPRLPDLERRSAVFRAALSGDAALLETMLAAPPRGPYPPAEDPVPLVRRRLAEATARPAAPACPCAADWQRILVLLGAE